MMLRGPVTSSEWSWSILLRFDRKVDIPRPRKLDDLFGDVAVQLVHDLRGKIEHLHLDDQTEELLP